MPRSIAVRVMLSWVLVAGCSQSMSPGSAGDAAVSGPGVDAAAPEDTRAPDLIVGIEGGSNDLSCAQIQCHTLPANTCDGATLKTFYDANGTCAAGVCSYNYSTQLCRYGCQDGRCLDASSGCDGGSCNPPAPCDGSACGADACQHVTCNSPPANACDGSTLKTYYDPTGTCSAGTCNYKFTTSDCPRGCQDGKCITVACTPGSASFSANVTDLASLVTVGSLPALAGGAGYEIRSYMQVKDSYAGVRVPIYAPTNMTILAATHYHDPQHDPADTSYTGEWGLTFEASCTTQVSLAHIREVVTKISDVTVAAPDGGSAGELVSHPVDFVAGEIIGYYIRGPGYFAWDFVVTDTAVTNQFANMPRYQDGQLKFLHAICPFDPYPPQMRQAYLDILGTNNDPPRPGRKCGTVAHDHVGSIAGVWFHAAYTQGTADQARTASGNPLSVFKAETDAIYVADLDGDTTTVGFLTFRIDPTNATYLDPESVTTNHCYQRQVSPGDAPTGWVYLNLVSATQLQVAYGLQGGCPAMFPTTGVRTYYR